MNHVMLIGRLTKDPEVKYTGEMAVARYTLAVDRQYKKDGDEGADFVSCVAFGKSAEFAEKYLNKGLKIAVEGRIRTGNYTNKDGQTVYTTDVVVDRHEFCESKNSGNAPAPKAESKPQSDNQDMGFVNVPEDMEEELPFG